MICSPSSPFVSSLVENPRWKRLDFLMESADQQARAPRSQGSLLPLRHLLRRHYCIASSLHCLRGTCGRNSAHKIHHHNIRHGCSSSASPSTVLARASACLSPFCPCLTTKCQSDVSFFFQPQTSDQDPGSRQPSHMCFMCFLSLANSSTDSLVNQGALH